MKIKYIRVLELYHLWMFEYFIDSFKMCTFVETVAQQKHERIKSITSWAENEISSFLTNTIGSSLLSIYRSIHPVYYLSSYPGYYLSISYLSGFMIYLSL